ncbi:putative sensor histidine kinase [Megalodesulfovibrio gigas DSM 1382 = ATCC 19364]|uniref:histidine kinase n=1 Tax=Megalodesulfovibrio gigas (strain ATCC 19364 / DSM 1382 / NCIMB 9332 / VKM B-1759) TaxID=1121448 RepID=T2G8L5_MEGG1|nr:putative sensor histidine kinase [Megalodesulfovibrio gigas DSM 1382 = ATCC 19364]
MPRPPDSSDPPPSLREKLIGLGERSIAKSYYPELKERLQELERFRALMDAASDAIFLVETPSLHIMDAVGAWRDLLDKPDGEVVGVSFLDLFPDPCHSPLADQFSGVASHATVVCALRPPPGTEEGALVEMSIRLTPDGGRRSAVVVVRDVTERAVMEKSLAAKVQELQALHRMGMAVASYLSVESVIQSAFKDVMNAVEPDLLMLFTADGQRLRLQGFESRRGDANADQFAGHGITECLCGATVSEGEPLFVQDIHADPRCTRDECKHHGLSSMATLPLRLGNLTIGVLALGSFTPRNFGAASVFLRSAASIVTGALHNAMLHEDLERSIRELNESRENLTTILDTLPVGVILMSAERKVLRINGYALKMLDYDHEEELLGKTCREVLCVYHNDRCPIFDQCQEVDQRECDLLTRKGRPLTVLKSAIPITLEGQRVLLEAFTNISELKETQLALQRAHDELEERVLQRTRELQQANDRLQELDQLKSSFLTTVSHDLRTPLTSIYGFAKLIRRDLRRIEANVPIQDPGIRRRREAVLSNIDIILNESERLTRLINDFLDLSKIEEGRYEWADEAVDLGQLALDTVDSMRGMFLENPALTLHVQLESGVPLLQLDPDRIQQVLVNLLSNAYKFTSRGEVSVEVRTGPQCVQVSVSDTGEGIPAHEQERIFERFHQVVGDTLHAPKGTGLGLAICRRIVEHYRGRIWVESRVGEGSRFIFELPRPQEDCPPPC